MASTEPNPSCPGGIGGKGPGAAQCPASAVGGAAVVCVAVNPDGFDELLPLFETNAATAVITIITAMNIPATHNCVRCSFVMSLHGSLPVAKYQIVKLPSSELDSRMIALCISGKIKPFLCYNFHTMNHPRSAIVLSIFALVVIAIGIAALTLRPRNVSPTPLTTATTTEVAPPSAAVMKQLEQSHGFQALVSYSNGSFQPSSITIKAGQAIRFINNSTHDIWIGQITAKNTPLNPNTEYCDVPFNSCHALHPGDFAEFTFPQAGTFLYMDDLNTVTRGAVVVK